MATNEILRAVRLHDLAEALQTTARRIAQQLDSPHAPACAVDDMLDLVLRHLEALPACLRQVADSVEALMPEVIDNDEATTGDVYRAAGRFEFPVDELLTAYRELRTLDVTGYEGEMRDRLAAVIRHFLLEIEAWIDELVSAVTDPERLLGARGLPMRGNVTFAVHLELTAAPRLRELSRLIRAHATQADRGGWLDTAANWFIAWA